MLATIQQDIDRAVDKLVDEIVAAILTASLGELVDDHVALRKPSRAPRAPRRAPRARMRSRAARTSGPATLDAVVAVVRDEPGIAIGKIQEALSLTRSKARGALAAGVKAGRLKLKGVKRAARYYAAG